MSEQHDYSLPEWPYAHGGPVGNGDIKTLPEDFIVDERLPFAPAGEGEHVFLLIEKVGENTDYVARALARYAGVRQRDIGFAGQKDRHARTTQWFSIWLPGKQDLDWSALETESIKINQVARHARKLKRGVIASNRFQIRIRNWRGDRDAAEHRLQIIQQQGFPNYFAEQRFGRDGQNVNKALILGQGKKLKREQRSLYLSAIRAYLFNQVLAERVRRQNWRQPVSGDLCKLRQSNSLFKVETVTEELEQRMKGGDIHATGILFGKGEIDTAGEAGNMEKHVLDRYPELTEILLKFDLDLGRRALRTMPEELGWIFTDNGDLQVNFSLPAGSYATALLRELVVSETTVNR
ncbi:tRNA pseudouridine(13) synthase TruD [Methylomarinum sp. Ch1-1]|uniref:tRNA pseudouridine synthase D n=1 Tax=Methylomarinum roseum TaxID=3067653 RepID=A0AAU7NZS8_9GAMM